jgi:toxin-antitoxin system PIN domain toxin
VILPDTNLLLYAYHPEYTHHAAARAWWEHTLNGSEQVGIPWVISFAFVRLSTSRRVLRAPASVSDVLAVVTAWLDRDDVEVLREGPRHRQIAFDLLGALGTAGNLTTDVQIAAFAIEYGATLHTNDGDFARMPGVAWRNPLS